MNTSTFTFSITTTDGANVVKASKATNQEQAHRAVREMIRRSDLAAGTTVEIKRGNALLETFTVIEEGGWDYTVHNARTAWKGCTGANAWRSMVIGFTFESEMVDA